MFEKFTEAARRVVFWARHEASSYGTGSIDAEHLLLGICREDTAALRNLGLTEMQIANLPDAIRQSLPERSIPTSVDMPLSQSAKKALAAAAEISDERDRGFVIYPSDILAGVARQENTVAAKLLERRSDTASD